MEEKIVSLWQHEFFLKKLQPFGFLIRGNRTIFHIFRKQKYADFPFLEIKYKK